MMRTVLSSFIWNVKFNFNTVPVLLFVPFGLSPVCISQNGRPNPHTTPNSSINRNTSPGHKVTSQYLYQYDEYRVSSYHYSRGLHGSIGSYCPIGNRMGFCSMICRIYRLLIDVIGSLLTNKKQIRKLSGEYRR